jgi:hypothetical protein
VVADDVGHHAGRALVGDSYEDEEGNKLTLFQMVMKLPGGYVQPMSISAFWAAHTGHDAPMKSVLLKSNQG